MIPQVMVTGYNASNNGIIEWSTDAGTRWIASSLGVPSGVPTSHIWYANNAFWVCGGQSDIFTSTDGINWTVVTRPAPAQGTFVVYTAGFLAGKHILGGQQLESPYHPLLQTSTDGLTWTYQTIYNATESKEVYCLGYGLSKVFIGVFNGTTSELQSSTDCVTWSLASTQTNNVKAIAGSASEVVASMFKDTDGHSTFYRSTNGTSWTAVAGPANHWSSALAYGNGMYVSAGTGGIATSTDGGQSWTLRTDPTGSTKWSVAFGSNTFVAVGVDGSIITSTDGITWTQRPNVATTGMALRSVAFSPVPSTNTFLYDVVFQTDATTSTLMRTLVSVLIQKALTIYQESTGTPNHSNRLRLANNISISPMSVAQSVVWGILGDPNVAANGDLSTDTQISAAVDNVINVFAFLP